MTIFAIKLQAITWTNIYQVPCDNMASLGLHELFDTHMNPDKMLGFLTESWYNMQLSYKVYSTGFWIIEQWPLLLTWFNFNPSMDK